MIDWNIVLYIGMILIVFGFGLFLYAEMKEREIDRKMAEKRTYPAINVNKSGTRREELLIPQDILQKIWVLRKLLYPMEDLEAMEFLLDKVKSTKNNDDFFNSMRK